MTAEFGRFGFEQFLQISASHSRGLKSLREHLLTRIQDLNQSVADDGQVDDGVLEHGIRVAVVGRPNVGKSTLVNRLLGEERQVVFDMPGTTKDSIEIPFAKDGVDFVLIDTAGVRRKGSHPLSSAVAPVM